MKWRGGVVRLAGKDIVPTTASQGRRVDDDDRKENYSPQWEASSPGYD